MYSDKRHLHQKLRRGVKRSSSSQQWLQRQLNDPYVHAAHDCGFRGRAAFKIEQLNDQFHFFKSGKRVVDLGCAPGGWSQIAVKRVKSSLENPIVIGMDLLPTQPLPGATFIQKDFTEDDAPEVLSKLLNGNNVDIVMSDMAANTTGNHNLDHLRIMNLVKMAYDFAVKVLNQDGVFIAKIFQGGSEQKFLEEVKRNFKIVKHAKPDASRKDSSEFYLVALGFKGKK